MAPQEGPPSDNLYISELPAALDEEGIHRVFGAYGAITSVKLLPATAMGAKTACLIRFQSIEEAQWIVENLDGNIPQGLDSAISVKYAESPQQKAERMAFTAARTGAAPSYGAARAGGYGIPAASPYSPATYSGKGSGKNGKGSYAPSFGGKGPGAGFQPGGGKGFKAGGGGSNTSIRTLHQGLRAANALPDKGEDVALYIAGLPRDTEEVDLFRIFSTFGPMSGKGCRVLQNLDGTCKGIGFVNFQGVGVATEACTTLNGTQLPDGTTLTVKFKDGPGGGEQAF